MGYVSSPVQATWLSEAFIALGFLSHPVQPLWLSDPVSYPGVCFITRAGNVVVWGTYCSGVHFTSPCRPYGYTDGLRQLLLWGPFHLPVQACGYIHGSSQLTDSRTYFSASSRVRQLHLSLRQVYSFSLPSATVFSQMCVKNSVHEGGRCTPLGRHPSRHTPPDQTPPSPREGHCSGRYASYWSAFLFKN